MALDPENKETGYRLGRLFAVSVVEIDQEWEPKVTEEIGDEAVAVADEYLSDDGEIVSEGGDEAADSDYSAVLVENRNGSLRSDSTASVVADSNGFHEAEFSICQLPFVSIISPVCRSEWKKVLRLPDAQERRRMVEELLKSMMQ